MNHLLEQLQEEFPLFTGRSDRATISKITLQETANGAAQIRLTLQVDDGSTATKAYTITSKKALSFFTNDMKRLGIKITSWLNFQEDTKPLKGKKVSVKNTEQGLFIHPLKESIEEQ